MLRERIETLLADDALQTAPVAVAARVDGPSEGRYRLQLRTQTGGSVDHRTLEASNCEALVEGAALVVTLAAGPAEATTPKLAPAQPEMPPAQPEMSSPRLAAALRPRAMPSPRLASTVRAKPRPGSPRAPAEASSSTATRVETPRAARPVPAEPGARVLIVMGAPRIGAYPAGGQSRALFGRPRR